MSCPERPEQERRAAALYWLAVVLVRLKVLWGIWERDLTSGDTSSYFLDAVRWSDLGKVNIVWSPLYTAYFGTLEGLFGDARAAVLVHRVLLIVTSTVLAAWAARRTLPQALAFLAVLWWVALPIHYDTLYEVHLFGALVAIAALLVSSYESEWKLPLLVALYGLLTVLVRNENILCFAVLAGWLAFRAWHSWRLAPEAAAARGGWMRTTTLRVMLLAVACLGVVGSVHQISRVQGWRHISEMAQQKHRLNMCQVYAFGHQQRNSGWTDSPWTGCKPLMKAVYGSEMPTIGEMLAANPRATMEHFLWNLSLTPAGLEVLFFNATTFTTNPDYAPVRRMPVWPTVLSVLALAGFAACVIAVVCARRRAGAPYLKPGEADWLVLLAANVLVVVVVILTQRPRPSYLLGFGFLSVVAFLYLVKESLPGLVQRLDRHFAWIAFAAILLVPSYRSLPLPSKEGRLSELYGLLKPQAGAICKSDMTVAFGEYAYQLRNYVCRSSRPVDVSLEALGPKMDARVLEEAVRRRDVDAVIFDVDFLRVKSNVSTCAELDEAFGMPRWERFLLARHASRLCDAAYLRRR